MLESKMKIIGALGAIGGLAYGIHKKKSVPMIGLYILIAGAAGAFIGNQLDKRKMA